MTTYIFKVEITVTEEMYIEADNEDWAKENILEFGHVDENKTDHSVRSCVLIGEEND